MCYLFVSLTCFTIPFATFVNVSLCDVTVAQPAISLTLTDDLFVSFFLHVVIETCLARKVFVAFQTSDSNPCG
jgi:hypothetical protein